jgi:threonine dehydratase
VNVFRETPVESYVVNGVEVLVKREDLCAEAPMPPLAKMRGVFGYLARLADRVSAFGILDTRISKSGQGVAVLCQRLGLRCRYYFPQRRADGDRLLPHQLTARDAAGAELVPLPAGRLRMLHARAKQDCARHGGLMLPAGLPFYETVEATARVVEGMEAGHLAGTIVLSTGTGTILAGVLCGLLRRGVTPARLVGVSASMDPGKQRRTILKHVGRFAGTHGIPESEAREAWRGVQLVRGEGSYYTHPDTPTPWPSHPYYEWKAWAWAQDRLEALPPPVLFWNIGQ